MERLPNRDVPQALEKQLKYITAGFTTKLQQGTPFPPSSVVL
jgi:hypothetical protein